MHECNLIFHQPSSYIFVFFANKPDLNMNNLLKKLVCVRGSVPDCGILQGFPESWQFSGAVYQALGQIGNAVPPPIAYQIAISIAQVFS